MTCKCRMSGSLSTIWLGLWWWLTIIILLIGGQWMEINASVLSMEEESIKNLETTAITSLNQYISSTIRDMEEDLTTIVPMTTTTRTIEHFNSTLDPTTTTTTTTTTTNNINTINITQATIEQSCVHGILKMPPIDGVSMYTVHGRYLITIITSDPYSPQLVLQRANAFNLLESDFEIGARIIHLKSSKSIQLEELLRWEMHYKEHCLPHVLGVYIDYDYFIQLDKDTVSEFGHRLWPLESGRRPLFSQIARLLYDMPWPESMSSVEILTQNTQAHDDFLSAMQMEHICPVHFPSNHSIRFILVDDKYPRDVGIESITNGNIFVIPLIALNNSFLTDLPDKTNIFQENELILRHILQDNNPKMNNLSDQNILPSRMLNFAHSLLQLIHWLKSFLNTHCQQQQQQRSALLLPEECESFLKTAIISWRDPAYSAGIEYSIEEILQLLHLNDFRHQMTLKLMQKLNNNNNNNKEKKNGEGDHQNGVAEDSYHLHEMATMNPITNVTTFYYYNLGNRSSVQVKSKFGQIYHCQYPMEEDGKSSIPFLFHLNSSMYYWRFKPDNWVVVGLTLAIVGIICAGTILIFMAVRMALGDVFEGNPMGTILLLLSLILMFSSIVPFCLEYVGEQPTAYETVRDIQILNSLCGVRIFLVTQLYCLIFALLLCRAIMLACIGGTDGGFLSHVNGYLQAVIGILSVLVQLGMSLQLLIVMQLSPNGIFCDDLYYGYSFFGLLSYDLLLLLCLVGLIPFVYRSQRNYREGLMLVITVILLFIIWMSWISVAFLGIELRDIAIPLGLQASGWAVLLGILIPRTFLILRGIEHSDLSQTLPSLTTLALAHNNQQFYSEQSGYECVNPAMRHSGSDEVLQTQLASEMPTLPIRRNNNRYVDCLRNSTYQPNGQVAVNGSPSSSLQISLPPLNSDDSKMTRF